MTLPVLGLLVGLALGFALAFGGLGALVVVGALGALGLAVGRVLAGELDLTPYLGGRGRSGP